MVEAYLQRCMKVCIPRWDDICPKQKVYQNVTHFSLKSNLLASTHIIKFHIEWENTFEQKPPIHNIFYDF
jgi:hypothetical protein